MKRLVLTLAAIGLAGAVSACSQEADTDTTAPPEAPVAAQPAAPAGDMAMDASADAKMAKGSGTVTAVSADSITIDHEPIAEANWPAMVMDFKAPPEMAGSVKPGDKVVFDLKLQGGGGEITAIRKQ